MEFQMQGTSDTGSGAAVSVKSTANGDLHVVQYLPKYAMLTKAGVVFAADTTGGTAAIPVVTAPTTSPQWCVYNANPGGGKSLVLLQAWCSLESGTAGLGCALMCGVAIGDQTVISTNASGCVISCLDGTNKLPLAYVGSNPTLIGGTPSWVVIGAYDQIGSDGVGEGIAAYVDGMFIAPPKSSLCLEVVAETGTTAKYDVGFVFAEVQL
jgi:hypothetical protein